MPTTPATDPGYAEGTPLYNVGPEGETLEQVDDPGLCPGHPPWPLVGDPIFPPLPDVPRCRGGDDGDGREHWEEHTEYGRWRESGRVEYGGICIAARDQNVIYIGVGDCRFPDNDLPPKNADYEIPPGCTPPVGHVRTIIVRGPIDFFCDYDGTLCGSVGLHGIVEVRSVVLHWERVVIHRIDHYRGTTLVGSTSYESRDFATTRGSPPPG